MEWRVVADIAIGLAAPAGALALFAARRIALREVLFVALGIVIGLTFELFIGFMPGFIVFKMSWPLPMVTILISHSLWDGGLFMAGCVIARIILRRPLSGVCAAFDWRELAIMIAWGAASAFVVELIGNGVMWEYQPQKWNPVWITIRGQGYTAFIQIVWLVAPVVFYLGCLRISKALGYPR
ncbi:MAG: hypothetical protein WCX65_03695 [bacterium]